MKQGIESEITNNQLSQESSSLDPHLREPSPGSCPLDVIPANAEQEFRKREARKVRRTDSGKLHRVKHGILSRDVLHALISLGEDRRTLRRLENEYRVAFRPTGPVGELLFDRFFSSYLRLVLAARSETQLLQAKPAGNGKQLSLAIMPGHLPTLVAEHPEEQPVEDGLLSEVLPPDLLRGLVLVQRYDRHFSREMYRSIAMLLLLRRSGEAGLESWASEMLVPRQTREEV